MATDSAGILVLEQNALHKNIVIAALFFIARDWVENQKAH